MCYEKYSQYLKNTYRTLDQGFIPGLLLVCLLAWNSIILISKIVISKKIWFKKYIAWYRTPVKLDPPL